MTHLRLHSEAQVISPSSMFPHTPASSSPLSSTLKTSKPIKGAGKIMNKPGKHEINIRRKKYGCP